MDVKLIYLTLALWILNSVIRNGEGYAYNYHFMQEMCNATGINIYLEQETSTYGKVKLTRGEGYSPNLSCRMIFWAPQNYHIVLRFKRIEIYRPDSDCTTDYLHLSGNTTTHKFCGTGTPSSSYVSSGRHLELEFFSGNWTIDNDRIGFDLYYTSFHHGPCESGEFACWNSRCIPGELKCENLDNCGDWSDERVGTCGLPTSTIILISLIALLCCGTCIAACAYFYIDKKKDRRRRGRGQNSNNVVPSVEYNTGSGPPPYSSYFTTPPYSALDEKPPAYSNSAYDLPAELAPASTTGTTESTEGTNETTEGTNESTGGSNETTDRTAAAEETPPSRSGSSVVTPPTRSGASSPAHSGNDVNGVYSNDDTGANTQQSSA